MPRPPQSHLRKSLADRAEGLGDLTLALVTAPGGYGKTTLARRWLEGLREAERPAAWLTLSTLHADLTLFLEDLVDAIRETLPPREEYEVAFGETIERTLSSGAALRPDRLARELGRECRSLDPKPVLFLDALEHLPRESASRAFVDALLRLDPSPISIVVTTRGSRPEPTSTLLAAGAAELIGEDDLSLRSTELEAMLREEEIDPEPELVATLLARTGGWAMAVRLMVRALAVLPEADRLTFLRESGGQSELFEYVANELLGRASPDVVSLVETAALLGPAPRALLVAASDLEDGEARIAEAIDAGLLTASDERFGVHDLWKQWLVDRMRTRHDGQDWRATQAQIGFALETDGQSERALDYYVDALERPGVEDRVVRILSEEADRWVSRGHRRGVEAALHALRSERRNATPALIALEGLLLSGRDPDRAITHLKAAAAAYQDAGNGRAEFMCLHELAVVAINENRVSEVWAVYRRAVTARRVVKDPALRGFVLLGLGHGSWVSGRYGMARRFHDVALTYDHDPRERGGIAIVQASIGLQSGAWNETMQTIESLLAVPEQRQHGITFHAIQVFRAAIDSARGRHPEQVRGWLDEAIEAFQTTQHTLNLLRAWYVLGRHGQLVGDDDTARRSYEQASALARRSEFWEALSASEGCLARLHQRRGAIDEARSAALRALAALEAPEAWSIRRGRMLTWATGIALACSVLADLGDSKRALAFLETHRRRFEQRELPLCHHAVLCLVARIERAGRRRKASAQSLREAWKIAEKAGLEEFSPELDPELLAWAAHEARALGIEGKSLEGCLARLEDGGPPPIALYTLGGLAVERRGQRVRDRKWRGTTPRRLLMRLLVADGRTLTRAQIEAELWPDMSSQRAGNNLRVAISHLRDVLEPRRSKQPNFSVLDVEGDRVGLTEAARNAWDVAQLRGDLEQARQATVENDAVRAGEAARRLSESGSQNFLPESFDDWVLDFSRALDRTLVETCRELANLWSSREHYTLARRFARIALARDPADERGWEILVAAFVDEGDRSSAMRAYEEASIQLARELDADPGPTLRALVKHD